MKLTEVFEFAAAGSTSVASIGQVEFSSHKNQIKLYKRDSLGNAKVVAKIKRKKSDGWRLITTKDWKTNNLPHFGHLENIKLPMNGQKTISGNLQSMLKIWGIRYEELINKT